jgi:CheY-like chemotaxis protein
MRVLVVDDDPVIRELLSLELGTSGHQVEAAPDGEAALVRLRQEPPPDALVFDVMMPGLTGWELLTLVRADPALRHLPVVLLSARDVLDDVRNGYALGASLVLSKPWDSAQLLTLLEVLEPAAKAQARPA